MLGRALRHAIERQHLQESLGQARAELEQRVQERTAELARANDSLRAEVAERRRTEEWLSLAQGAGVGTFDWNLTADAAQYSSGSPAEQGVLSGEDCFQRLHPEDRQRCREDVERALREREPFLSEFRVLHPDGTWHWTGFRGKVLCDEGGQPIRLAGVFVDVAERKEREEALRQSERRLRLMLEQMPAILWTTDTELRVTFASGAGLAALNLIPEQWLGRTILEYFQTEDRTLYPIAAHDRALAGESVNYELEWQGRIFRTHLEPLRDTPGRIVGCIGVTLDVTAHRRGEAERRELEVRIQEAQKLESLGTLAGGLAHDFNNLLTGILGNASLALMDLPSESSARYPVQQVEEGALRAAELTRQLLAYSGRGKVVVAPIDLSRLIEDMAALLKSVVVREAHLRVELAAGLPAVQGDAGQIRQVLLNLITNASEALGEKKGAVGVRTGVMVAEQAYLATTYVNEDLPPGHYGFFEVSDTGCGMDEATMKRIFDPFFSTKFTGRGLGLAAVLGIVRGHHGAIKVYSEPGRGSAFKVLLPCVDLAHGGAGTPAPRQRWRGSGTVLLMDDEEGVRQVARRTLELAGFQVITASDGQEGIELFRQHAGEIVAVVLDLAMPRVSGEEVFRELRLLQPEVRVVLMSGYNEEEVANLFAGKRLAGFVQKPFRVDDFLAVMRRALEG
jgi:PAS domain S-box-containing protein